MSSRERRGPEYTRREFIAGILSAGAVGALLPYAAYDRARKEDLLPIPSHSEKSSREILSTKEELIRVGKFMHIPSNEASSPLYTSFATIAPWGWQLPFLDRTAIRETKQLVAQEYSPLTVDMQEKLAASGTAKTDTDLDHLTLYQVAWPEEPKVREDSHTRAGIIVVPDNSTVFARTRGNTPTMYQTARVDGIEGLVLGIEASVGAIARVENGQGPRSVDGTTPPHVRKGKGWVSVLSPIDVMPEIVVLPNKP